VRVIVSILVDQVGINSVETAPGLQRDYIKRSFFCAKWLVVAVEISTRRAAFCGRI